MAIDTTGKKEEYQGPGRIASSLGKGVWNALEIASIAWVIEGAVSFFAKSQKVLNRVGVAALAVTGIAAIYGLVTGWMSASKGKKQFEDAQSQLVEAKNTINTQQQEVMAAHQEVASTRKAFTDSIKPRAEHGSHAAAHEAGAAAAATQEAARA